MMAMASKGYYTIHAKNMPWAVDANLCTTTAGTTSHHHRRARYHLMIRRAVASAIRTNPLFQHAIDLADRMCDTPTEDPVTDECLTRLIDRMLPEVSELEVMYFSIISRHDELSKGEFDAFVCAEHVSSGHEPDNNEVEKKNFAPEIAARFDATGLLVAVGDFPEDGYSEAN